MHRFFFTLLTLFSVTTSCLFCAPAQTKESNGANLLEQTSQAFTQISNQAMPATVFIKAEILPAQGNSVSPFNFFQDDAFQQFFNLPQQRQPQMSGGSGFLVSSDGYIVTNHHVIQDASKITVVLNDGSEYSAVVKGTDARTDLAVLKIDKDNLPYLSFGDSDTLQIGEWVIAIGNPFGIGATLTVGVVSAKGRQDLGIASYEDFIQTDAAINPGNSGGPLLNLQGQVVGVNTAIFTRSGGYMGIGLSIPSAMAENIMTQIMQGGSVKRAYLGVILQPIDKDLADAWGLKEQEGILISDVVKDSPATQAGLQEGDIILQAQGKPVKSVSKLRNEIALMAPGSTLKLKVLRNNKKLDLVAKLTSQENEVASTEIIQKLGLDVENLTNETCIRLGYPSDMQGIVITKVKPGSIAALAGIRPGFLITGMALPPNTKKAIRNTTEFEEALKQSAALKYITLIIRHQSFQKYYTLKL